VIAVARYGTNDLEGATRFYDAITALAGGSRVYGTPQSVAYRGPEGGTFVIGLPFEGEPTIGNGTTIAFAAPSRAAVDAMHAKALELGAKDEGAPGMRGDDATGFYGAYFRDLDGNKLAVACMGH